MIPAKKGYDRLPTLHCYWQAVRARAGLDDLRILDLRHSYALRALALGERLYTIGRLLGHRLVASTFHYAHLARDSVREAAVRVEVSIAADIMGEDGRPVSDS